MNRNSLARSILFLVLAAVALASSGALTLQRRESALFWRTEAQRAADALASLEGIRSRTSEAERDRFGYAVTGDKSLLGHARDTLAEASEERDKLSPRLETTAAQRQRLELLTGLLRTPPTFACREKPRWFRKPQWLPPPRNRLPSRERSPPPKPKPPP